MSGISEAVVEEACLGWFRDLGFATAYGPDIGPDGVAEERASWEDVVLVGRLRDAVARINPDLPRTAVDQVVATVLRAESQNVMAENARLHRVVTEGVAVEYRAGSGEVRHGLAWLVDFDAPAQRLVGGEPVHGGGAGPEPAGRRGGVRERVARRPGRVEEHRG